MILKFCILIFAFIFSTSAETVKVGNKFFECQKISPSTNHFQCGQAIVASVDGNYFYFSKDENKNLVYQAVSQVRKNNLVLFELSNEKALEINKVLTSKDKQFYEGFQFEYYFKSILEEINHPTAKMLAKEFSDHLKEYELPSQVNLKLNDKKLSCTENKTNQLTTEQLEFERKNDFKIRCPFYSCTNEKQERSVLFLPSMKSLDTPYFLNITKGNEAYLDHDFEVRSSDLSKKVFSKIGNKTNSKNASEKNVQISGDSLAEDVFYSKKLRPWKDLVKFFSSAENKKNLDEYKKICDSSELNDYLNESFKLSDRFRDELSKEDLEHLIMVVNNVLFGVYIPKEKSAELGCLHQGSLLTINAFKYVKELEKLNQTFSNESLSEDDVQKLFDEAKNMKDIPFGYKYDGCYARAHLMARRFEKKGIKVEKIWVKGALSVPGTDVKWNFHVAPVVSIVDPVSKKIKKLVIDPSLANKAVTPEEWLALMKQNVRGKLEYTQFPFPSNAMGFERTAVAFSNSDQYKPDDKINMSESEKINNMNKTLKDYLFAEKRNLKPIF